MHLRPATLADLPLLRGWDDAPHVAATGGDPDWNDWDWENQLGRPQTWREMLIAEVDGRAIGFVQIMDPDRDPDRYWGEVEPGLRAIDIWIGERDAIGKGNGRAMMTIALDRCFADPAVAAVLVDPMADNTSAHRFYAAMGFRQIGPRRFGPDDCLVMRIDRAHWRQGD